MIVLEIEQGSREWTDARRGIPTSSQFKRIVKLNGERSASRRDYMNELLAAWQLNEDLDGFSSGLMQRGSELEKEAFAYYEMEKGVEVRHVGLVMRDDKMAAASTDGLVGDDGALEVKCYAPAKHMGVLMGKGQAIAHKQQVQGGLWLAEREWCDFLAYHPSLPPAITRVERDDEFIKVLEREVNAFVEDLLVCREKLSAMDTGASSSEGTGAVQA